VDIETMGPFPLQLAQRYVAPHRIHYRSLSLTIAHYRSEAQRSAAVVEMPFNTFKIKQFRRWSAETKEFLVSVLFQFYFRLISYVPLCGRHGKMH